MTGNIALNQPITFGKAGKVTELNPFGFDLSERGASWTTEEVSGFSGTLAALPPVTDVKLVTKMAPFTQEGRIDHQQLFVFINGLWVGFQKISAPMEYEFMLPRYALMSRSIMLSFVVPTAVSPRGLGSSPDIRKLGLSITNVTFVAK